MALWLLKTVCAVASSAQWEELQMSGDPPAELGVTKEGLQSAFQISSGAGTLVLPVLHCSPGWSRGQVVGQLRAPQTAAVLLRVSIQSSRCRLLAFKKQTEKGNLVQAFTEERGYCQ